MEKKTMPRVLAMLLAIALVCTSIITVPSTNAQAAVKAKKITLTATKKQTLYLGKSKGSFTLKVKKVTPANASKAVTYKSSKPSVASVDKKGKVKAKKAGKTTITVTSKGNKKVKATCTVEVKQGVTEIETASALTLQKGKNVKLNIGYVPGNAANAKLKNMKFSTNKKAFATVDSKGKIKAKKAGKATITIQSKDGTVKKKISVKVVNKINLVNKITLDKTSIALNIGESATLKATPSSKKSKPTSKKVYWVSENTKVATVSANGKVTAVKEGTAKIKAIATDNGGKSVTCKVTVTAAGITLDQPALALQAGGDAALLTAYVNPETVSDPTVMWTVDPAEQAAVAIAPYITPEGQPTPSITITPLAEGTVTVYASTANGWVAACPVTVVSGKTSAIDKVDGNLQIKLDKSAKSYQVDRNNENGEAISTATVLASSVAEDYNTFKQDIAKSIWDYANGENFFAAKWNKFAEKLNGLKLVSEDFVGQVTAEVTNANVITITAGDKTATITRTDKANSNSCDLVIVSGNKMVKLADVTTNKADGVVTIKASIQRDGKDSIPVTVSMSETKISVSLYEGDKDEHNVMTFTDDAEANAYVITVNATNYEHIKQNLKLSLDLDKIAVWNIK